MDAQLQPLNDLAAIFVCQFHDLHGQILHDGSLVNDGDVDLQGVEFSALPSGLHLVEQDVFFFDHKGLLGQCVFVNEKSEVQHETQGSFRTGGGGRGRRMWSVGILVYPSPASSPPSSSLSLPSFPHLPFIYEAATSLSADPNNFTLLQSYFATHRRSSPSLASPPKPSPLTKAHRLLGTSSPSASLSQHHPLHSFPHLVRTMGPSVMTLYKVSLAGARILFFTRPPLKTGCEFAWCVWAMGRSESHGEGEGESKFLGSVGLTDLGRLEEFGKERGGGRGWVGCTTDALLKERPHLYDLLIDLSSPLPHPPLLLSPPASTGLSSSSTSRPPPPRIITYSSSALPLYNQALAILDPSLSTPTPLHDHDCSSQHSSSTSPTGWRGLVDLCFGACEWCLGLGKAVLGGASGGGGVGGEGRVRLPSMEVEDGDSLSSSLEEEDELVAETIKRAPSPLLELFPLDDPSPQPLLLLHLFAYDTITLTRSINRLVSKRVRQQLKSSSLRSRPSSPSTSRSPSPAAPSKSPLVEITLGARDLLKLGLGVEDGRVVERLGSGVIVLGAEKKSKRKAGGLKVDGPEGKKVHVRVKVDVGRWWSWVPGLA